MSRRLAVITLLLVGLILRVVYLDSAPMFPYNDELAMIEFPAGNLNTFHASSSTIVYYPYYLLIKLFGFNPYSFRAISILYGILTCLFVYLAARIRFGKNASIFALVSAVFSHWMIVYSRSALPNITSAMLISFVIYLLELANSKGRGKIYFFSGLIGSISLLFYTSARMITFFLIAYLLLYPIKKRSKSVILTAFGYLIGLIPSVIVFLLESENLYFQREKEVFFTHVLSVTNLTEVISIYSKNVIENLNLFIFSSDKSAYYFGVPLLDPATKLLLLLSIILLFKTKSNKIKSYLGILILFFVLIIFSVSFTDSSALSSRLTILAPIIILVASAAVNEMSNYFKDKNRVIRSLCISLLFGFVIFVNLNVFIKYLPYTANQTLLFEPARTILVEDVQTSKKIYLLDLTESKSRGVFSAANFKMVHNLAGNKVQFVDITQALELINKPKVRLWVLDNTDKHNRVFEFKAESESVQNLKYKFYTWSWKNGNEILYTIALDIQKN